MNGNHRSRGKERKKKRTRRCVPSTLSGNKSTPLLPPTCHIPPPPSFDSIDKEEEEVKGKEGEEERRVIDVSITRFVDAVADRR